LNCLLREEGRQVLAQSAMDAARVVAPEPAKKAAKPPRTAVTTRRAEVSPGGRRHGPMDLLTEDRAQALQCIHPPSCVTLPSAHGWASGSLPEGGKRPSLPECRAVL
jgi:hypothetical protein